ncbi:MAG: DUF502 domain-containing protein [Sandaracinaceae bacterium]
MKTLARIFFQGLLVFVPVAGTIALVWWVLSLVDQVFPVDVPGLGIASTVVVIFLLGLLTNNVIGRRAVFMLEAGMKKLPVVSIIYTSIKDLLSAFAGDKRSFDKPVMITLGDGIRVFGFVTCDHFEDPRLAGQVAVYLPQAYNFAGNLVIVAADTVEPVDADSAQFMAFVVSGGVARMGAASTVMDSQAGRRLRVGRAR